MFFQANLACVLWPDPDHAGASTTDVNVDLFVEILRDCGNQEVVEPEASQSDRNFTLSKDESTTQSFSLKYPIRISTLSGGRTAGALLVTNTRTP